MSSQTAADATREGEARRAQGHARKLGSLYYEKRYAVILGMVLKRVYLASCQLVHGAATHGGQLNREAVGRCAAFIGHFLPAASLVIIDHAGTATGMGCATRR